MTPHTMQIYGDENLPAPSVGNLFRVTEVEADVLDLHWGRGTHVALEPCASDDQLRDELAQARAELKDLRGANRALARQVADVTENRDYWYDKALDAEAGWDKARQEAQAQSDEVQRDWLSPCEAEGLRQQLGMLQSAIDNLCEQQDRQIDMEECGARCSYPSKFPDWAPAWEEAYELRYDNSEAAAKLLERLATLDAAGATLADCGIGGIYAEFGGLSDAIEQMTQYVSELARGDKRRAGQVKALQAERQKRAETERCYRTELADARRVAGLWYRRAQEAELAAHVHDKACGGLAQTVNTERALRQEAEQRARIAEARISHLSQALGTESRIRREAERGLALQLNAYRIERSERREAEQGLRNGHNALDKCQVNSVYEDGKAMTISTRIFWLNERAGRAGALAALVNGRMASVLEQLASFADASWGPRLTRVAKEARKLAAQIREALDDSQA